MGKAWAIFMISKKKIKNFNKEFDVVSVFLEHDGKILLLHRQDNKPQGNTWAMLAGKVKKNDKDLLSALVREIEEEIGLKTNQEDFKYFDGFYIRYPEFDYVYHIYHLSLEERPNINLNLEEHKAYKWITPEDALKLNLIQDEDICIKWFYNLS